MLKNACVGDKVYYLKYGTEEIRECEILNIHYGSCVILISDINKTFDSIPLCSLYSTLEEAEIQVKNCNK